MSAKESYNPQALSCFLAFRHLPEPGLCWRPGLCPEYPAGEEAAQVAVENVEEVKTFLRAEVAGQCRGGATGILLSGGIDSAILAAAMPPGSKAYTIRFDAEGAVDESIQAAHYCRVLGLEHHVVNVTYRQYLDVLPLLMDAKKAPLHAVEPALYLAASAAKADGINTLLVGNGADSTFGGLDKLLSKDWSYEDFIERYNFINPARALKAPRPVEPWYRHYRRGAGIDVQGFLKTVHGMGIIQSFHTAIHAGGCDLFEPYEKMRLKHPLDLERIRRGESKYILRRLFSDIFGAEPIPPKIAFARPMDVWLAQYAGPRRPEFRSDLVASTFGGDQRWLLLTLDLFLEQFDA